MTKFEVVPTELDILQQERRAKIPVPSVPTDDIGRLTAEAINSQVEIAVKAIEEMAEAVKQCARELEASLIKCDNDLKLIAESAAMIRARGQDIRSQVEHTDTMSKNIRKLCADFKGMLGDKDG